MQQLVQQWSNLGITDIDFNWITNVESIDCDCIDFDVIYGALSNITNDIQTSHAINDNKVKFDILTQLSFYPIVEYEIFIDNVLNTTNNQKILHINDKKNQKRSIDRYILKGLPIIILKMPEKHTFNISVLPMNRIPSVWKKYIILTSFPSTSVKKHIKYIYQFFYDDIIKKTIKEQINVEYYLKIFKVYLNMAETSNNNILWLNTKIYIFFIINTIKRK